MSIDTHLGSGKNYEKYYTINPRLLVGVPRLKNRQKNNIDASFTGYDIWHCYEFSTLRHDGLPISGVLKIGYPSNSPNIVESKSLKLYLNSWNFYKLEKGSLENNCAFIQSRINQELSIALESSNVVCKLFLHEHNYEVPFQLHEVSSSKFKNVYRKKGFKNLEDYFYLNDKFIMMQNLQTSENKDPEYIFTRLLRSNCLITNQPDFGDLYIYYVGNHHVTKESLLSMILSFRDENHFHEEVVEIVYQKLKDALNPNELFVAALYTRRGGIDINPVRANKLEIINRIASPLLDMNTLTIKSMRH